MLMELGITIVTSGMIMQLLAGANLINVLVSRMIGWGSETYMALFKFSLSTFCFRGAETAAHIIFVCIFSS